MIRVPAGVERAFTLDIGPDRAFALMRDVPAWGALFPGVEAIAPLAENRWKWTMAPMGPPGLEVRTAYGCAYAFDEAGRVVSWEPIDGVGNARFRGAVALSPAASGGTAGELWLEAELEIPAPRFLRGVVRPAVALEFGRSTDAFLARLAQAVRGL